MVRTLQVTLGAGLTPILPSGNIICKWVIFQNNGANPMRLGDANTTANRGMKLLAGGSGNPVPTSPVGATNLSVWYVIGTAADVLDVIYDDGAF